MSTAGRGHVTWEDLTILRNPPIIAGQVFAKTGQYGRSEAAPSPGIAMLAGNHAKQVAPGHPDAPRPLIPRPVTLGGRQSFQLDYELLRELSYLALDGLDVFIEETQVDHYKLRGTARTEWTISRWFPYDLPGVTWAAYPATVVIKDPTQVAPDIVLTPVETAPAAGEVQILRTVRSSTFVTNDLSAYGGRSMVLTYYPAGRYAITSLDQSSGAPNSLTYSLSLDERLPSRTYGATS